MTIPTLMLNYKKRVLSTRIKKFYSSLNQAVNMKILHDGELDYTMVTAVNNPDVALALIEANYKPFMKILRTEKTQCGAAAALSDGSGMYVRRTANCAGVFGTGACVYVVFCVNYKDCTTLKESNSEYVLVDARKTFVFWPNGDFDSNEKSALYCAKYFAGENLVWSTLCTDVLAKNGWEVPDDYPLK